MDSQLSQDSTHAAREGAIHASRGGLKPDRTYSFQEADTLVFIHLFPSDPVDLLVFFCRTRITYHFAAAVRLTFSFQLWDLLMISVVIVAFYKQTRKRRGGAEEKLKINPSECKL